MARLCAALLVLLVTAIAPACARANAVGDVTGEIVRPGWILVPGCEDVASGENCGPGNNRQTQGGAGTGKVSHHGWPAISGVLWQVVSELRTAHGHTGTDANDELLGHHGDDTIDGGAGDDVLWGDWDPLNNNTSQHDVLRGGPGDDWLYSSHGTTRIAGGRGSDHVWAYYGHGTIDCGPGYDVARVRMNHAFSVRNCEVVGHF